VNGRPTDLFKGSRGLRQHCPLSPFHILMKISNLPGIKIIRGVKSINHLGASSIMAMRFKRILDPFNEASRGKINNNKSQIYGWNIDQH
jgi:hypothetical protein